MWAQNLAVLHACCATDAASRSCSSRPCTWGSAEHATMLCPARDEARMHGNSGKAQQPVDVHCILAKSRLWIPGRLALAQRKRMAMWCCQATSDSSLARCWSSHWGSCLGHPSRLQHHSFPCQQHMTAPLSGTNSCCMTREDSTKACQQASAIKGCKPAEACWRLTVSSHTVCASAKQLTCGSVLERIAALQIGQALRVASITDGDVH